jgi:lipopolysaccharide transport system ATP-binding protein
MANDMINVQGLGKRYQLRGGRHLDLRDGLGRNIRSLFAKGGESFWALRDVGFSVAEGETLGIIGRNGAGKSTLLKIISRITYPTEGRFEINGRMSSLLEVGTGFHMELTGRENIFLNGTILGMRRAEVKRKFDEIVAFSGVEAFLDNPVKHYSSGQKVRLAFAVAAHLEPEVLIIDEVLAVGDVEFQRKCLGKMKDVASHGRTVLFVSHNMSAVNSLCDRCILLDHGRIEAMGPTPEITRRYLAHNSEDVLGSRDLTSMPVKPGQEARFVSVRWVDGAGGTLEHGQVTKPMALEMVHEVYADGYRPQPVVLLFNSKGEQVFTSYPGVDTTLGTAPGRYTTRMHVPADLLNADTYYITLWLVTWLPYKAHQVVENVMGLEVLDDVRSATHPPSSRPLGGVVRPHLQWEIPGP